MVVPGALYGRITVDQLGHARPDLRNPTLATMTEALIGAENRYSGISTIRRELQEAGLPAPVFENRRNEFVVTARYPAQPEPKILYHMINSTGREIPLARCHFVYLFCSVVYIILST